MLKKTIWFASLALLIILSGFFIAKAEPPPGPTVESGSAIKFSSGDYIDGPTYTGYSLTAGSATNSGSANALAANGTNCGAGQYPLGVDAAGNVESCTAAGVSQWTASGNDIYNSNSGNIGIGTTTPGTKLDIQGITRILSGASGTYAQFAIGRAAIEANLAVAASANQFALGAAAGDLILRTEATSQALILNSGTGSATLIVKNGNVGVGTWNPLGKLHITSNSAPSLTGGANAGLISSASYLFGAGAEIAMGTGDPAGNAYGYIQSRQVSGTGADPLTLNPLGGNVGIGKTNPGTVLDVVGGGNFTGTVNGTGLCISSDCKTAWDQVAAGGGNWTRTGTNVYLSTSTDKVGIGTTAPSSQLNLYEVVDSIDPQLILENYSFAPGAGSAIRAMGTPGTLLGQISFYNFINQAGSIWLQSSSDGITLNDGLLIYRTGNVGIGNLAPTAGSLVIGDGTTVKTQAVVLNSPAASWAGTIVQKAGTEKWFIGMGNTSTYGDRLLFRRTASSNDMTIDSSGNVGIGTTAPTSRIHGVATLSAATGDEIAYRLNYTTNKATSGNDTGLVINQTDTASPGTSYLLDLQVGGASQMNINNAGTVNFTGTVNGGNANFGNIGASSISTNIEAPSNIGFAIGYAATITNTNSQTILSLAPTYNQASGAAANTDLLINRTETAIGSGAQYLINAQVGGTTKFNVKNTGAGYFAGSVGIGTTAPTDTLDVNGAGRFRGSYNESTTNPGLYTGIVTTPRLGFFNGTAADNWQIDNNGGTFRWFTPGVERMKLNTSGSNTIFSIPGSNAVVLSSAGNSYFSGGYVGIATTDPQHTLDVAGALKATDYYSADDSPGVTSDFVITAKGGGADCTLNIKNGLIVGSDCPTP